MSPITVSRVLKRVRFPSRVGGLRRCLVNASLKQVLATIIPPSLGPSELLNLCER